MEESEREQNIQRNRSSQFTFTLFCCLHLKDLPIPRYNVKVEHMKLLYTMKPLAHLGQSCLIWLGSSPPTTVPYSTRNPRLWGMSQKWNLSLLHKNHVLCRGPMGSPVLNNMIVTNKCALVPPKHSCCFSSLKSACQILSRRPVALTRTPSASLLFVGSRWPAVKSNNHDKSCSDQPLLPLTTA